MFVFLTQEAQVDGAFIWPRASFRVKRAMRLLGRLSGIFIDPK